jgi:type III restriction enzyme
MTVPVPDEAPAVIIDEDLLKAASARLRLRTPNREALDSLVFELVQHYSVDRKPPPFECVIDSATGVGKTFIMIGALEYLAAQGVKNFLIIAPGTTIADKTAGHFTPGNRRFLLDATECDPYLVTKDNFASSATRQALADDSRVKVHVFTVQSLLSPSDKTGRKTRKFQESLGSGFYTHLATLDDLTIFADEHHCYFGPKYASVISELDPWAVIGLTATPDPKTPAQAIIYRYPLAAAIADKWVKTPVIVARKDNRSDPLTKLADGVRLLDYKQTALDAYTTEQDLPPVHPVMLVVAQNTAEADEFGAILRSVDFEGGRFADAILVVHSNLAGVKKEAALAALDTVEDSESPVRVIIAVGKLKEGWDVKNVYVIASMRASVSSVLTEQTLGRGLRLPFDQYTNVEMLDTLEVLAHEKYEALLARAGVLNEQFIDRRSRAVLRRDSAGQQVAVKEEARVEAAVIQVGQSGGEGFDNAIGATGVRGITDYRTARVGNSGGVSAYDAGGQGTVAFESVDARTKAMQVQTQAQKETPVTYEPQIGMPTIQLPILSMTRVESNFGLADIIDLDVFRKLGRKMAANPETELRRMRVAARIVVGHDGLRRTELVNETAVDRLEGSITLLSLIEARRYLVDVLLDAPIVPKRANQAQPASRIVDQLVAGIRDYAGESGVEKILSSYAPRAAARLISIVTAEHAKYLAPPSFADVVKLRPLALPRPSTRQVLMDRAGKFNRSAAYDSFTRCLYPADWFDSEPERAVANMLDDSDEVSCWVRLHVGELPILWRSDGREYNADIVVIENSDIHWIIEIKADDTVEGSAVQQKRRAAERWVNHVNADESVTSEWHYLLATETDIDDAAGSWAALKCFGV